jgi:transcription termination/antitermination protein NusG
VGTLDNKLILEKEIEDLEKQEVPKTEEQEFYDKSYEWYILYVMGGLEHKLRQKIEDLTRLKKYEKKIKNVIVPVAKKVIVEQNKKKERVECIFSSYIFIQANLDEELCERIATLEGSFYFLGARSRETSSSGIPYPMHVKDLDLLFSAMNKFKETDNCLYLQFAIGDYVKITSGVFRNCRGKIKNIYNNKVTVESDYLSAADIKEIPLHTIEKIDFESEY